MEPMECLRRGLFLGLSLHVTDATDIDHVTAIGIAVVREATHDPDPDQDRDLGKCLFKDCK